MDCERHAGQQRITERTGWSEQSSADGRRIRLMRAQIHATRVLTQAYSDLRNAQ